MSLAKKADDPAKPRHLSVRDGDPAAKAGRAGLFALVHRGRDVLGLRARQTRGDQRDLLEQPLLAGRVHRIINRVGGEKVGQVRHA